VLAIVQLVAAVLLVVAGIRVLGRRTRAAWLLLVVAHVVQVVLAGYWAVRMVALMNEAPGPDPEGAFAAVTLFFAACPLVGLGLVLIGAGRRWFEGAARA
jgi:hypothetical protein